MSEASDMAMGDANLWEGVRWRPEVYLALMDVTGAAIALRAAERERFRALRAAAERRRDAIAAGASVAEIPAAIRAGHEGSQERP